MHRTWHAWRPGELATINQHFSDGETTDADASIIKLIEIGQRLEQASDGLFNPAAGKLIGLWGFHRDDPENAQTPNLDEVNSLVKQQPSMMDIKPMVTMITDMIGSPISRRRNTRSTLMARKKVMIMLMINEIAMWIPTHAVRA